MLPTNPGGHAAYQDTFASEFLKFYPDPFVLPKNTWNYIVQFWYLDLSQTDSIMKECYSVFGPEPRLPSCMLRSYLLALKLKVTSITVWCRMLRESPIYAILSGFPFGDPPGVGTFYDFFSRIWQDNSASLSPKGRFPKMKPPKGKKKGDKTPCDSSSIASKLLPLLERWHLKPQNPFSLVFRLYQQQFLDFSIRKGLINPDHLALAGDGTPVRASAQQRKKRICNCRKNGCPSCNCKRHYSQPDCNWGWDSHRECYFFGYHLYMYVASDSYSDLPVFPLLERACRHDMLSFLHSFFTMKAYLPEFRIEKLLLDSAHDAYAVYEYCRRENITPFIDLTPVIPDILPIRTILPLMTMVFQSVSWAYVCTKMDMRLPNTGQNTDALSQTGNMDVSVSIPVHRRNTEGPYTSSPMTIQGCLTYRQGTASHGKRNMTGGLLRNALTSVRKKTISRPHP